jgi:hypothetical protein
MQSFQRSASRLKNTMHTSISKCAQNTIQTLKRRIKFYSNALDKIFY